MLHKLSAITVEDLLSEFRRHVKDTYGDRIDKIYLYGSYARGDNDAESDVDICIVVNDNKENINMYREELSDIQCDLGLRYDVLISLMIKTKEEFEERKNILPFYMNIIKEGISL